MSSSATPTAVLTVPLREDYITSDTSTSLKLLPLLSLSTASIGFTGGLTVPTASKPDFIISNTSFSSMPTTHFVSTSNSPSMIGTQSSEIKPSSEPSSQNTSRLTNLATTTAQFTNLVVDERSDNGSYLQPALTSNLESASTSLVSAVDSTSSMLSISSAQSTLTTTQGDVPSIALLTQGQAYFLAGVPNVELKACRFWDNASWMPFAVVNMTLTYTSSSFLCSDEPSVLALLSLMLNIFGVRTEHICMSLDCHSHARQSSAISLQTIDVDYSIWILPGMEGAVKRVLSKPWNRSDINHILRSGVSWNFNISVEQFSAFCLSDTDSLNQTISTAPDSSLTSTVFLAAFGCASAIIISLVFVCRGFGFLAVRLSFSANYCQTPEQLAEVQCKDSNCLDDFSLKDHLQLEEGFCIAEICNSHETLFEQRRANLDERLRLDEETELVNVLASRIDFSSSLPANLLTANQSTACPKTFMPLFASSQKVLANLEKRLPEGHIGVSQFEAELDKNLFWDNGGDCQSEMSQHSLEM